MTVCDVLLEILAGHGVKYIFGIPGDAINELIESIRKQDKIKFIHVMHEESGAFAASAQAKLSGGLTVCAGTAGPGAIHLLNGLYDAKKDHAPVLAITGQTDTTMLGQSTHQEVNLTALFQDVAVYNHMITDPAQMPEVAVLACQSAMAQRGVAHINIPANISSVKIKPADPRKLHAIPGPAMVPHFDELHKAAHLINSSKKVCILAGIGAKQAVPELLQLADLVHAPIVKSLRGKDLLPDLHPLTTGGIGLLGTNASYKAMKHCDLLLVVGSDLPYVEFYPDEAVPMIQVDNNAQRLGRRHSLSVALAGESRLALRELLKLIQKKDDDSFLREAQKHKNQWLESQDEKELSNTEPLHPQRLARLLSEKADEDAVICCDTGAVTVWGARNFRLKGTQLFTLSGGLASMAFALPAAIGAQLLFPEKQVIALCGDGGFAMLMCDFATAVKYKLNIKIIVFNNSKLGLIQMEEEARSGNPEWQTDLHDPDYALFAQACGGEGFTIKTPDELESVLPVALRTQKPCVINVFVNPTELTLPPKITAQEAFNFIKAKIKETLE